jgi:hypothetical protein
MLRFLFRFAGLWLIAGAFVAAVIDGTRSIAAGAPVITPLRDLWSAVHPQSIERLQAAGEGTFAEVLLPFLLGGPVWAVLGVAGALLLAAGRKPRHAAIGRSARN